MTMMIMRFNKLIQSKLLWMLFLGVIIVTFVFWGAADFMGGSGNRAGHKEPVASFDGENILWYEMDQTRRLLREIAEQSLEDDEDDHIVYDRLAALSHAKQLGIDVPAYAAEQQFLTNFQDESGQLNQEALQQTIGEFQRRGIAPTDLIEYVRQELILNQYYRALGTSALVSTYDVNRFAARTTDEFVLNYTAIDREEVESEFTLTDEQVNSYFSSNKEDFEFGEARKVKIVAVPFPVITDTNKVSMEMAEDFYAANPDRYSRVVEPAEGDTNTVELTEAIPFEEVQEAIMSELKAQVARDEASEAAMTLSVKLIPRRGKPAPAPEVLVASEDWKAFNLTVVTTDWFRVATDLSGFQNPQSIVEAAKELDSSETGRVSEPVSGFSEIYIVILEGTKEPRIPELSEVLENVTLIASNHYLNLALGTQASNQLAELETFMETSTNFTAAAESIGLVATSTPPYQLNSLNAYTASWPIELAGDAAVANQGEVFGPVSSRDGSWYIGHVNSRVAKPEQQAEVAEQAAEWLERATQEGFAPRLAENFLRNKLVRVDNGLDDHPEE